MPIERGAEKGKDGGMEERRKRGRKGGLMSSACSAISGLKTVDWLQFRSR